MRDAAVVPLVFPRTTYLAGSQVGNFSTHFGALNYLARTGAWTE
ncbi:hypothetical protein [Cryptosporangium aurantiacum]|uniref:Uncharacterized protein n=1 Tax=Cryptosporangium aurantiacum TaxID=134849 RepID=A0A1M7R2F8_9ACTN|nr:hypothetical protein [Cryptosporangium aurantiacum]SHN38929.1 hypothetical protein SAMN05443668_106163 [Cryptosporangium aurantiacum]